MIGTVYLPFKPIKGQAFTLAYTNTNFGSGDSAISDPSSITIYKDGASGNASTNSSVSLGLGNRTLALTASEMNANFIIIHFEYASSGTQGTEGSVIIYTVAASAKQLEMNDTIDMNVRLPSGNLTVAEVLALLSKKFKRNNNKI